MSKFFLALSPSTHARWARVVSCRCAGYGRKKLLVGTSAAGLSVDIGLYPLDTIKTRLQSPHGFLKAGGFRGVYKGLGAAATGSAPGAALFFSTYELSKKNLSFAFASAPVVHMTAASVGEVMACCVRVPTENVKQKVQAGLHGSPRKAIAAILKQDGVAGFYAGFGSTIMREIPFAFIQFPIYEQLKKLWQASIGQDQPLSPVKAAACGSFAGAIAAAATTPMDVVKTRLMLGADEKGVPYKGVVSTLQRIRACEGTGALFSGVVPRVTWITIGGFIFFGTYELAMSTLPRI